MRTWRVQVWHLGDFYGWVWKCSEMSVGSTPVTSNANIFFGSRSEILFIAQELKIIDPYHSYKPEEIFT